MSGRDAQRGFIFQSIIAMIECLDRDDWDEVKLEPDTDNDKVDIQLYKDGTILSAIQVKSSASQFERSDVAKWLEELKKDAAGAKEVRLCLVGDSYSPVCVDYITLNPEIKQFPFNTLMVNCRAEFRKYIADTGLDIQINDDELRLAYNNFFSEIHNNSISNIPLSRDSLKQLMKRVLSIPKCLTVIPDINRDVGIIGRDEVMQNLRGLLDQNGCIALISGLGGIGKTAVMRWICNSIAEDRNTGNHVAWITCGETLRDDILLLRDVFGIPVDDDEETAYRKIIQKLKRFRGTLYLFLDNMFREPGEEEISIINSLQPNVHIMITSRHDIEGIPVIPLDVLDLGPAVTMFYKYYGRDQEQKYRNTAESIVDTVHRHTLLVELLAKAAGRSEGTLEDFNEKLKANGFFDVFNRQIETEHDKYLTIEDSVIKLYEISSLTEAQKHIMKLFTIFTAEKEIYHKVVEWAGLEPKAVFELVGLAWLEQGGLENGFRIHQIIKDSLARRMKRDGEELKIEEYGELVGEAADTESYMPKNLEYLRVRERLILAEDVARYVEGRIGELSGNMDRSKETEAFFRVGASLFNNIAVVYEDQGDYSKALWYYETALRIIERVRGSNHIDKVTMYNNIALVYRDQGDYAKALEYYEKVLEIGKQEPIRDRLDIATTYNNIALVYRDQGDYAKALQYYEKALKISEYMLGCNHSDTATTYNNIAMVYNDLGDYTKALEYYGKAQEISERELGSNHPYTATTYNNIAVVYRDMGFFKKAIEYYSKALNIRERVLGIDHPYTATTYNNMALVFCSQGAYKKALEYCKKALKICEKSLGIDHPDTATTYNNIALVYSAKGDYKKALEYDEKALAIVERVFGSHHPFTATAFNNMAGVYHSHGAYAKALEFYSKALDIRERELGNDHPDTATTYNNMAIVYREQGKYMEALECCEKALKIGERVLGSNHPDTATMYNNIAMVYRDQGAYAKALEYYEKNLEINKQVLGINHPDTATSYNNIAGVYHDQGDNEKSLEFHRKALTIREQILGNDHPDTATTYNNIALVYSDQGYYTKALEYYCKALTIRERVLGYDHLSTAAVYNNIAGVYEEQGDHAKAIELYDKALEISKQILGREHPSVATIYNNMANVYRAQCDYEKAFEYYEKSLSVFKVRLGENHPYTQTVQQSIEAIISQLS